MGNKAIVGIVKKGLVLPLRSSYKSACHHPLLLATATIFALLYRFLPFLFNLLLSISPVLVCTFLLLAILLTFSEPNVPDDSRVESPPHDHPRRARVVVGGGIPRGHRPDNGRWRVKLAEGRDVVVSSSNRQPIVLNSRQRAGAKRDVVVLGVRSPAAVRVDEGKPNGASDSDSERGESSLNGSVGDIIPVIDELHPLIAPAPNSDASSSVVSSPDQTSDNDGSEGEETENHEEEEEEEETNGEKDDGTEAVLKWTADDEKNLRDVGTSELERNQRLEHLIAKRRARIYLRSEAERNLIDLGTNDASSVVEELSRLLVMIPPRKNPFDLPYLPEEAGPGSAPTVLVPRRNPFDLPSDEGSAAVPPTPVEFGFQDVTAPPVLPREAFFRRHESFAIGASIPYDRRDNQFKPYFVTEGLRQALAHTHSNDPVIGPAAPGHVHASNPEAPAANGSLQGTVPVGKEAQLPRDAEAVFPKVVETIGDGGKDFQKLGNGKGVETERAEVVEEKYNGSSSSSEGMADAGDGFADCDNSARPRGESPAGSHDSIKSVISESALMRRTEEANDEKHIVEPVYDSSPSAVGKSSTASFDEALLSLEKKGGGGSSSSSSSTSSSDTDVAEASLEEYANDGLWVASPSLALVDREESEAREISEIREDDVIQAVPTLPLADVGSFKEAPKLSSARAFPGRMVLGNDESRASSLIAAQPSAKDMLPPPSPPSMFGVVETKVSILPPIPEEIVEDLKHEEQHDVVEH